MGNFSHLGNTSRSRGNVSFENAEKMRAAGADMFVAGTSSVFAREGTLTENIAEFREAIRGKDSGNDLYH